ncbi:LuxR family transcriptional regulator [Rhodococcus sp. RD6.2]|uniref:helix-turn-helix transcriptional regulator n=1 Tax=Rhodococcus sp. RD6.2 TaxID=260936 RepID=UPI00063B6030|nr:LuxR C-terminal-related transcriptional regulator [Rhodococcus sp. RD6.2]CRK50740.1 LuxR family transcriptional regulator [Rhodococcus sp. RD6.2]
MNETPNDVLRPSDEDALRAELRALSAGSAFPVLFGGAVSGGSMLLTGFAGTRTRMLRGLTIDFRCGLGGRAVAEQRPEAAPDYFASDHITHDYDVQVAGEGIESLLAVPVVVRGVTRAALYGGLRVRRPIGDVMIGPVLRASSRLAREIEIRDEVDRRVEILTAVPPRAGRSTTESERITESYLALRDLAARVDDEVLAAQLREVEDTLRTLTTPAVEPSSITLSPREFDVLSHVALGCRNVEIADRLSLSVETVKTYMRNLMAKLDVNSRQAAVVAARRSGLIP